MGSFTGVGGIWVAAFNGASESMDGNVGLLDGYPEGDSLPDVDERLHCSWLYSAKSHS